MWLLVIRIIVEATFVILVAIACGMYYGIVPSIIGFLLWWAFRFSMKWLAFRAACKLYDEIDVAEEIHRRMKDNGKPN